MTAQGRKKLSAEQFNRACEILASLDRCVQHFQDGWRLNRDITPRVLQDWLRREYQLGRKYGRREARRG